MLGLNKGEVKLAQHSTEWEKLFQEEKKLLKKLIGEHLLDIQHIGSTAIADMEAKPIIDIVVGVKSMLDVKNFDKAKLKENGYYHLHRVKIDGKEVFAKFSDLHNLTKTHILHVVEYDGNWWHQHIFFRDYLIHHPQTAKRYESLKKTLSIKYPNNESAYSEEKRMFVDDILSRR